MSKFINAVVNKVAAPFRQEPVVVLGSLLTAGDAVRQALTNAGVHDWKLALPVLGSLIWRQWVYSPATVQKLKAAQGTLAVVDGNAA